MPRRELQLLFPLLLATCGPKDPDDTSTSAATGTTTAATTTAATTTDPTTTAATTTAATTTAATPTEATGPTTDATTTGTTTTDTATTGAPPLCGEQPCPGAQICVFPCCGGPPPSCSEPDGRGKCEGGQDPVPADQCQFNPCAGPLCCPPIGCTPDPPFCVEPALLTCDGNSCNTGSCFGTLNGAELDCQCA